ncbi:Cation diffusion facilitator family transporter [Methylocella tundrae]|uniref:Cation diffusion facilitator family transporter n=1 Tax=Methylocella tundrae TaxID=227605 RepID=A0A8B6M4N1_METTU|nr:cation diffusion facilitator family transporter [Methylocella tundrae]VTZ49072.1 Cation diffusion facilitator family transporter [Methylocella tundrae]
MSDSVNVEKADQRLKEGAALASIAVSAAMTIAKLIAGLLSGSLAVLSEAGHNLADVATTALTYFAIRIAHKPADDEHQYGHAKVEALAALIETGFLFALSAFILVEAVRRLYSHDVEIRAGYIVFAVLMASIVVDLIRWRSLSKISKATKSEALAADALHFSSDIIASLLAIGGLVAARFGFPQGDAIAALGVAAFVAVAGYKIGRRTIDTLVDAAPKGLTEKVWAIAASVPGVIRIEKVRLRPAGPQVIGDIEITVARTLSLETMATIKANVAAAIKARHPEVAVTISTQPIAIDSETIIERILLIAAKRHLPVHHVTIQEIDGRASISFDVELDGRMPHRNAHEIASGLENEISKELGSGIEVESHIEPLEPRQLPGHDAEPKVRADIEEALIKKAHDQGAELRDIHNVRVRRTPSGLVVNYHCRVDPALSVDEVHDQVDALERKVRAAFKTIIRIVGHAEPAE